MLSAFRGISRSASTFRSTTALSRNITTSPVPSASEVPIVSFEQPDSACASKCGEAPQKPRKKQIMQYTLPQLEEVFQEMGVEKFRARQVYGRVYKRGARSFMEMTELKPALRERLEEEFDIISPQLNHVSKSTDGTRKYLMKLHARPGKGDIVETVFIPGVGQPNYQDKSSEDGLEGTRTSSRYSGKQPLSDEDQARAEMMANPDLWDRGSLCVSSQIGCSLQCAFCHTGTMSKSELRNLGPEEIIGQVMLAKHDLGDYRMLPYDPHDLDPVGLPKGLLAIQRGEPVKQGQLWMPNRSVSNVVAMGMGEPAYAYSAWKKAIDILTDSNGLGFGRRRITISTSGVVPIINKMAVDSNVNLAISLHAVRNDIRDILVPINKQYPLETLIEACRNYPGVKHSRVVTWEYVMLDGVNDSDTDARELVSLLADIPSLVNLIPFNPWPGSNLKCSSYDRMKRFQEIITEHPSNRGNIRVSLRTPRGRDILAACGQLAVLKNAQNAPKNEVYDLSSTSTSTTAAEAEAAAAPVADPTDAAAPAAPVRISRGVKPAGVQNLPTAQEKALDDLLAARNVEGQVL